MSHELLHHVEPKLFFCLLKLFKFDLVFEFDLKTIGKIKRKGIRNSREKGKPILAQHSLWLRAASLLLIGGEVTGAGAGVDYRGFEVIGVGQDQREGPANSLVGFRPLYRNQRRENSGGKAPSGSG